VPPENILGISTSLKQGWTSLLIFLGILIPVFITIGPLSEFLSQSNIIGSEGIGAISIIVWVPILITIISLIVGWKTLPKTPGNWFKFLEGSISSFSVIGVILLFSFAASDILKQLHLPEQLG